MSPRALHTTFIRSLTEAATVRPFMTALSQRRLPASAPLPVPMAA